jgi:hypothetical protein
VQAAATSSGRWDERFVAKGVVSQAADLTIAFLAKQPSGVGTGQRVLRRQRNGLIGVGRTINAISRWEPNARQRHLYLVVQPRN